MIKTSKDKFKPLLDSPAVTICVDLSHSSKEKVDLSQKSNTIEMFCPLATSANDVSDCFNKDFYNSSEIIEAMLLGENITENMWNIHITHLPFGKCHTMKDPGLFGIKNRNSMIIAFNKTLPYRIFLHDPSFFFMTTNPITIPKIDRFIEKTSP